MTSDSINTWQDIQLEVLNRIRAREWKPGEFIPNESELAAEFGCARATVNRALQAVAESGLIDRRRKAGTRVAMHPERKAVFSIPIIRKEVEAQGKSYSHQLLHSSVRLPPASTANKLKLGPDTPALELHTLHLAGDEPFSYEERWINLSFLPQAENTDFSEISANEWLITNAPFTHGTLTFLATSASAKQARILQVEHQTAIFAAERATWHHAQSITFVKLLYQPGYRLQTEI